MQVHPVLMLIGFIILGSEGQGTGVSLFFLDGFSMMRRLKQFWPNYCTLLAAIMSYKILPWSHDINKMVHLLLHAIALFLGSVGVYAAFKFHNESGIANLYSLHSWVGLGTICLYGVQVIHTNHTFGYCEFWESHDDRIWIITVIYICLLHL